LLKHAQKNKTLNKYLTSKFQFSPNFTLDSVADSNYRGKCDVGGFLIFECTIVIFHVENKTCDKVKYLESLYLGQPTDIVIKKRGCDLVA
jgi:hypothetical protein